MPGHSRPILSDGEGDRRVGTTWPCGRLPWKENREANTLFCDISGGCLGKPETQRSRTWLFSTHFTRSRGHNTERLRSGTNEWVCYLVQSFFAGPRAHRYGSFNCADESPLSCLVRVGLNLLFQRRRVVGAVIVWRRQSPLRSHHFGVASGLAASTTLPCGLNFFRTRPSLYRFRYSLQSVATGSGKLAGRFEVTPPFWTDSYEPKPDCSD